MPPTADFTDVLRDWAETFMHRSMREFSAFMRQSGLSMPQTSTLFHLYYHNTCGVSDIANYLGVTSAGASQMIDRLVQQGLLERSEHPEDRRVKQVSLTPRGRELIERSIEARQNWWAELTTSLTPEQQEAIKVSLRLLTQAARHGESETVR